MLRQNDGGQWSPERGRRGSVEVLRRGQGGIVLRIGRVLRSLVSHVACIVEFRLVRVRPLHGVVEGRHWQAEIVAVAVRLHLGVIDVKKWVLHGLKRNETATERRGGGGITRKLTGEGVRSTRTLE